MSLLMDALRRPSELERRGSKVSRTSRQVKRRYRWIRWKPRPMIEASWR